jgi:hypothetical protein
MQWLDNQQLLLTHKDKRAEKTINYYKSENQYKNEFWTYFCH